MGALAGIDRRRGAPPEGTERALRAWSERLPDSPNKAWIVTMRAWRLSTMDRASEAVAETERATEMTAQALHSDPEGYAELFRRSWLCEMHLSAERPERAAPLLDVRYARLAGSAHTTHTVRVAHALGQAASEEAMEAI